MRTNEKLNAGFVFQKGIFLSTVLII